MLHEGADVGPVDWLLARGLLVPLDAAHVELPHSVGVSLRGGFVIENFSLTPPVPRLGNTSAGLRRNAALGAIAETLRLVGEVLYTVREQPLATLRSGGVGVREMKRLADSLRIEVHEAGVLAELCGMAGLLRLDVDSSAWVQPPQLEWLSLPRQEQWLWLVNAWLASERAPSLVGQPVNAAAPGPAGHRGAGRDHHQCALRRGAAARTPRWSANGSWKSCMNSPWRPRRPTGRPRSSMPPPCWSVPSGRSPGWPRRFSSLIRGILAEAEMLGLIGSGALSQLGAAIAAEQPDDALGILGEHLPAALQHVLLQADLTAVAPGYLDPELSERLLTMATAEGQGPATIYRFSVASVRRALDAGQDAAAMLDFLRQHSATAIPQPLQYLIEDTAARHSRLRVGAAASFIQSEDETALLELLNAPAAAGLGLVRIAPTVVVSHAAPRETAQVLRGLGLAPVLEEAASASSGCAAAPLRPAAAGRSTRAPRTAPPEADIEAQLAVLRANGSRAPALPAPTRRRPRAARKRPSWAWRPC